MWEFYILESVKLLILWCLNSAEILWTEWESLFSNNAPCLLELSFAVFIALPLWILLFHVIVMSEMQTCQNTNILQFLLAKGCSLIPIRHPERKICCQQTSVQLAYRDIDAPHPQHTHTLTLKRKSTENFLTPCLRTNLLNPLLSYNLFL